MASSRPGFLRTFFRRLWWLVDASRRTFFNLLFLAIVVIVAVAWFKSGPPPMAEKTALVLDLQGSIAEQNSGNLRQSAINRLRGNDVPQKVQLRDVRDVLAAAADRSEDRARRPRPRRLRRRRHRDPARDRDVARPLQGGRQAGRRLGLRLRPAPVLPRRARRRGAAAPDGQGLPRGLRALPQLLQGRARPARRHRQPEAGRHLQERGRAVHRERSVAGLARSRHAVS